MEINNLTEDSLKTLRETSYAIFKNNELKDITHFQLNAWNRPFYDLYREFGGSSLENFKEEFKDCEMFELSLINKPVETTNEQSKLKEHEAIAKHNCYCGTIKKGQVYNKLICDLGCMYPGA